jgi:type IV secretion system protein TrbL
MTTRTVLLAAALLVLLAAAAAAQAPSPDAILDGVVRGYSDASAGWLERVFPFAQRLFAILATLEFAVSGIFWAVGRDSLDAVAAALLRKFMLLAFLLTVLWQFPLWLPVVTRGFEAAGQTASGTQVVNPSQIFDYGLTIGGHILVAVDEAGVLTDPAGVFLG